MPPNFEAIARRKAKKYGLNPNYFDNQVTAESNYDPDVIYGRRVSSAGAQGIAQMMPDTAASWGVDPLKPRQALDSMAKHMADYVDQFGSYRDALIAYNWGPGNVASKSQNLPEETRNYIAKVLGGGNQTGLNTPVASQHTSSPSRVNITPIPQQSTQPTLMDTFQNMNSTVDTGNDYISKLYGENSLLGQGQQVLQDTQQQTNALMQDLFSKSATKYKTTLSKRMAEPGIPSANGQDITPTGTALVQQAVKRANILDAKQMPYQWGGGHASKITNVRKATPLDCSGAVSAVLGIDPRVSGAFDTVGQPGRTKKGINIYYNDEHVLMEINGHFFGTSQSNPGGGAGWIDRDVVAGDYLKRFKVRHL